MEQDTKRFAFGKNWQHYLKKAFTNESYKRAAESLYKFITVEELQRKTFLDVGSGSGVHSLVAFRSGAQVTSFDYDENSVACTKELSQKEEAGDKWNVAQGSMLDVETMKDLGQFDIVYCWGVAHHTGDMWTALEHLDWVVKPGGQLFIAIYNTVQGRRGSRYWLRMKRLYVSMPRPVQLVMEWLYFLIHVGKICLALKNPVTVMRSYKKKRGMSYRHDLNDWLGGYPYEHATSEELFEFYQKRGYTLQKLQTTNYIGNNQLVLVKNS